MFTPISERWTVAPVADIRPDGFPSGPIPAVVPGVIHTDLLRAGLIDDPFDGDNEAAQQWIGDTAWRYTTTFAWAPGGHERHDLVAYGLDTVAILELNGHEVGRTENQHRSYRFDVRELLVEGDNTLTVTFAAPVPEVEARAERFGDLPQVNHHPFNQLRKTASHFGWDWGIDVAGCGIWQPIGIDSWSGVRIASVRPLVDVDGTTGVLTAHIEIERADLSDEVPVTLAIGGPSGDARAEGTIVTGVVPAGETTTTLEARVSDVRRWWPIGHGDQPLYDVRVAAGDDDWSSRVGFRTVRVDTTPDADGIPFTVYVNDRPVLVRGVNWIPDHAFLTEIDADRYARRLDDAVEANVNLIRVWGGGIYESDDFYDRADELGLLVWQDFLFACAAYAEEDQLSHEVEAEAREQVTRLSPHPSLVIWNGCNENIWGFVDWGWRSSLAGRTWGKGYYEDLLPSIVAELDPTRPYSPGSPYSFGDYLHPNDPKHGTMHIWDVWNQRDYTDYREHRPRFVSEFGFQGPPAWSTLSAVVHDEPLSPYGEQMLVHQKAHLGNQKLERGQAGHLPASTTIDHWHWATQLNQAHAIRFGIEHLRSLTPYNTGAILWQLNDNWPVVSWAMVDFDEHRKPVWYAVRDAFAPRLGTIQPRPSVKAREEAFEGVAPADDELAYVLVNDTSEAVHEEAFVVRRLSFDGTELATETLTVSVPARSATTLALPASVADVGDPAGEIIVVEPAEPSLGIGRAVWNPAEVADQKLDPEPLTATATRTADGVEVTVTASAYVRDVFLQVDRVDARARVDDGLRTLLSGESTTFHVTTDAGVDPAAFTTALVLRSANQLLGEQS